MPIQGSGRFVWQCGGGTPPTTCPQILDLQIEGIKDFQPVGKVIPAGLYRFTWNEFSPGGIINNSIEITDLETGTVLATGLPKGVEQADVTIPYNITKTTPGDYRFLITAETTKCGKIGSIFVITFQYPIYADKDPNPNLDANGVKNNLKEYLRFHYDFDDYIWGKPGYGYFAIPESMVKTDPGGNERPSVDYQFSRLNSDFVDPDLAWTEEVSGTVFKPEIAMNDYYTVDINFGSGPITYRVWRSVHYLGGYLRLEVQPV